MRSPRVLLVTAAILAVTLSVVAASPAQAQTPNEGSATRLYQAYFLRKPDAGGLAYWVGRLDAGTSLGTVSEGFARSPEFVNRYGALSDPSFVDLVYRNVLDRAPDTTGRAHWISVLAARTASRGTVMIGFSESPEFVRKTGTTPPVARVPLGRPSVGLKPTAPTVFDNADPGVLVVSGRTYLFGSTNNVKVPVRDYRGGSLAASQAQWLATPKDAMPTRPAWVDPAEWQIRAPSVYPINGRYQLFFSAPRQAAIDERNDYCIGRAMATDPMGPYEPDRGVLYCGLSAELGGNVWGRGAVDPQVVRAASGELYLLVGLTRTAGSIGAVRLDNSGRVQGGPNAIPSVLLTQGLSYHDGIPDGVVGPGMALDNPSMLYDAGSRTYLLFYSAGAAGSGRYVTGFARCAAPTGPCTADARGPFLANGNGRTGVGGLTAYRDPSGVARVAFASWSAGYEGQAGPIGQFRRQTHIERLVLSGTDPATQLVTLAP